MNVIEMILLTLLKMVKVLVGIKRFHGLMTDIFIRNK